MVAPSFITKIQPVKAPDGKCVTFEAKVEGNPRPYITWFRQTAIIKPSQEFQMLYDEDNVANLTIKEVFPEDAGMITCVAKNPAGFASCSAELIVDPPLSDHGSDSTIMSRRESSLCDVLEGIPPSFTQRPKTKTVEEGTAVELEVRLAAVPEPEISWVFNGKVLKDTKRISIIKQSDVHMYCSILRFKEVKLSDEGCFEVLAVNREGEAVNRVFLNVTPKKLPPTVVQPLKSVTITEYGAPVSLQAVIKGIPSPKISWYHNGVEIFSDAKTVIIADDDVHTLVIHSVSLQSEGDYMLHAENEAGQVQTSANVALQERPIPADFIEYFDDLKVVEGANVRFTAKFVGSPAPEVIWYRNGKKVKGSKNVIISTTEGVTSLEIVEARIDKDAGEYNCAIHNNAGKAICGALLEVSKPLSIFVRGLTNIEVDERTEVVLTCELRKATRVHWYKDGKEIKHTSRIEMIDDGYQHRLVILSTQMADSGVYQVAADTETSESKLIVKEAPATFVKKLQDLETKEREAALLEVEVSKEKAEVTWHKDGEPLKLDSGKYEVKSLGSKKQLIIRSVSIHDEGEYTCSLGENECTAELAVIELPPEIIKKLEDTTVARGETATFDIELTKGDALVRWFKDGKEINFDNRIELQIDGKKQRLTISRCVIEDTSTISCSVGDISSSAKLTVEGYVVEKRVEGGDRWEKVVTLEPSVSLYIVQNLKERSEKLYFRVTAENSMGYSEPAETKEVALKTHATVPTPPTAPLEMRPTGPHSIIVEWGEPESDGGAPIEGYVVAARDTKKTMWMEVGTVEAGVTRLNIKDMQEGHSYDVRVFARNEVGLSEPLESDEPIRVVRPPGYNEGEPVDEADQEVPSVSFSTETLSSWMKEAGMDADIKFYARSALLQRDEYFFRVWIYAKKLFQ